MADGLRAVQLGLNTADLSGSLRLYSEAFGFENAGGQGIWGETIAIQGLPPDSHGLIWWMVGRQPFFQMEFFHHGRPTPRPLRSDWRPCDLGWVRFGVAVADFDACLKALDRFEIKLLGGPLGPPGFRRAAFRDPYAGVIVEVFEDLASRGGPAVTYATSSVSDLEAARRHYAEVIGLEISPLERLHTPEDEALWGLENARRSGFLAQAGDVNLEIVQYETPTGRARPDDYRSCDQGMVNVALGATHKAPVAAAFERLARAGLQPPYMVRTDDVLAGYILEAERELELVAIPEAFHAALGFRPANPFLK